MNYSASTFDGVFSIDKGSAAPLAYTSVWFTVHIIGFNLTWRDPTMALITVFVHIVFTLMDVP